MKRSVALIRLCRPINGVMMLVALFVGFVFSSRPPRPEEAILGMLAAFTLNSSSNVMNDYFDREVDALNAPDRPIPSGVVTGREAITMAISLAVLGESAAALTSAPCLLAATIFYLFAVSYNAWIKKMGLVGNLFVSVGVSAPFLYGMIVIDGTVTCKIALLAAIALVANVGREVVKGISDIEGDAARDIQTVARKHSERIAAKVGAGLYVMAVGLSIVPLWVGYVSLYYVPFILVTDVGLLHLSWAITRERGHENALRVKNWTLIWMATAMVAFLMGGLL
ncbi:MAG: UbiA family prenyltransferase [Nitrososphaeria archaeon]